MCSKSGADACTVDAPRRYIYKTDYSRENEYGQKLDEAAVARLAAEEKIKAGDAQAVIEAEKKGEKAEKKKDK